MLGGDSMSHCGTKSSYIHVFNFERTETELYEYTSEKAL